MVKFIKRNNVIPVEFGEFTLEFVANDDSLVALNELSMKLKHYGESVEELKGLEILTPAKELLQSAWDSLFGVGTYDKVYNFAGQSTLVLFTYFFEMVDGINEEYAEQSKTEILKKYKDK